MITDELKYLNHFEIKTILKSLSDYEVFRIIPDLTSDSGSFYILFYKREGKVFCLFTGYDFKSSFINCEPSVSEFLSRCTYNLSQNIIHIDDKILSAKKFNAEEISDVSYHIQTQINYLNCALYDSEILKNQIHSSIYDCIREECDEMLTNDFNASYIFEFLFSKYIFDYSKLEDLIIQFNEFEESREQI